MRLLLAVVLALAGCRPVPSTQISQDTKNPQRPKINKPEGADSPFVPPPLYAPLFDGGAVFEYQGKVITDHDDIGITLRCQVTEITESSTDLVAKLSCPDPTGELDPRDSPAGLYLANQRGLHYTGRETDDPRQAPLVMFPGDERRVRDELQVTRGYQGSWCGTRVEALTLCFRRGAGLVAGVFTERRADYRKGRYRLVRSTLPRPAAPKHRVLVINELSAVEDWFEVVNVSGRVIRLEEFVYTDRPGDFSRVVAFPSVRLSPGGRHLQRLSAKVNGFQLAREESLAVYRRRDRALSDQVAWKYNSTRDHASYARLPDTRGAFTSATPTPGTVNR